MYFKATGKEVNFSKGVGEQPQEDSPGSRKEGCNLRNSGGVKTLGFNCLFLFLFFFCSVILFEVKF